MSQLNVTSLKHEGASGDNITLSSNGSVGVGTSSPAVRFHVSGSSTYVAGIEGSSAYALMGFKASGTTGTLDDANVAIGANGDALYFRSGGAERMRIDSAGRVTMPYQPAFCGVLAANASGVLVMTNMTLNNGSHYSTSNGKFTAPVAGMYHFILITLEQGSTGTVLIRKNGSNVGNAGWMGSTNATGVVSAIVSLAVGDYVEAYGTVTCEANNTGFCGFLVG